MNVDRRQIKIGVYILDQRLVAYINGQSYTLYSGVCTAQYFSHLLASGAVGRAISDSIGRGRPLTGQELDHIVGRQRRLDLSATSIGSH